MRFPDVIDVIVNLFVGVDYFVKFQYRKLKITTRNRVSIYQAFDVTGRCGISLNLRFFLF